MMNEELKKTQSHEVIIEVTEETYADLMALIKENGWDEAEGVRIILGAGLGYLKGKPFLDNQEEVGIPKDPKQLVARVIKAESLLASMRFRMFDLQQMNQNWELSNGAVFQENIGLKNLAKRRLSEVSTLRKKISTLEDEIALLQEQLENCRQVVPLQNNRESSGDSFAGLLGKIFNRAGKNVKR